MKGLKMFSNMPIWKLIVLVIVFLIFVIFVGAIVFAEPVENFGCQNIVFSQTNDSSNNTLFTKTYNNCTTVPVLNQTIIQNVTIVQNVTLLNSTFNETDLANLLNNTIATNTQYARLNESYNNLLSVNQQCQNQLQPLLNCPYQNQNLSMVLAQTTQKVSDVDNLGNEKALLGFVAAILITYYLWQYRPSIKKRENTPPSGQTEFKSQELRTDVDLIKQTFSENEKLRQEIEKLKKKDKPRETVKDDFDKIKDKINGG